MVSAGRSGAGRLPSSALGGGLAQGKGERGGGVERPSAAGSGGVLWRCTKASRWGGAAHGFCNETAQAPGVRMELSTLGELRRRVFLATSTPTGPVQPVYIRGLYVLIQLQHPPSPCFCPHIPWLQVQLSCNWLCPRVKKGGCDFDNTGRAFICQPLISSEYF